MVRRSIRLATMISNPKLLELYPPFIYKLAEIAYIDIYFLNGKAPDKCPAGVEFKRLLWRHVRYEAALEFAKLALKEGYDVIYVLDGPLYELAAIASKLKGLRVVLRLRTPALSIRRMLQEYLPKTVRYLMLHRAAVKFADGISCISRALCSEARRFGARRVKLIRHGVDLEEFKPVPKSREPQMVFPGGTNRLKGYKLVELIAKLLNAYGTGVALDVLGPFEPKVATKAPANVRFHGVVPRSRLPKRYGEAWIGLHLSFAEGAPDAVLEMLAAGTPVAASNAGDTSVLVGRAGLVVSLDARDALVRIARWIIYVLNDESVLKRLSKDARKQASKFTWRDYIAQTKALFQEVLRR